MLPPLQLLVFASLVVFGCPEPVGNVLSGYGADLTLVWPDPLCGGNNRVRFSWGGGVLTGPATGPGDKQGTSSMVFYFACFKATDEPDVVYYVLGPFQGSVASPSNKSIAPTGPLVSVKASSVVLQTSDGFVEKCFVNAAGTCVFNNTAVPSLGIGTASFGVSINVGAPLYTNRGRIVPKDNDETFLNVHDKTTGWVALLTSPLIITGTHPQTGSRLFSVTLDKNTTGLRATFERYKYSLVENLAENP